MLKIQDKRDFFISVMMVLPILGLLGESIGAFSRSRVLFLSDPLPGKSSVGCGR